MGGFFGGERVQLHYVLEKVISLMKEKGFELYVQEGSDIKKDDDYIKSILEYPIKQINHGYVYYYRGQIKKYNPKWKVNSIVDSIIPLDKDNNELRKLVIGKKYNNIWVSKDPIENIQVEIPEGYDLYLFDFEYELEDIIEEKNNKILIKELKLDNINKI